MSLWTRIKNAITGEATSIEATLTAFEQKYLPQAIALLHQIEHTIGQQGVTILEQALSDVATATAAAVSSGGNIGAAIAAVIPTVIEQAKTDAKADVQLDVKNAAYGAAAIVLANVPKAS